jgi:[NiFe] hydrogenase diaphorase moiety large subunit
MPTKQNVSPIEAINIQLETHCSQRSSLPFILPILQNLSESDAESSMIYISKKLDIPPVEISSLMSFFNRSYYPSGRLTDIRLCKSMGFQKKQVKEIAQALQTKLNLDFGETSTDGNRSLRWTACADDPQLSPMLWVNDQVYTQVKEEELEDILSNNANQDSQSRIMHSSTFTDNLFFSELKSELAIKSILKKESSNPNRAKSAILVCNVDEGEPLAQKSRILLTKYLPLVMEGMVVNAFVAGIEQGLIYLPNRYGYLKLNLERELSELRKRNLLGVDILGWKGFNFDVEVLIGLGDYVGREESALAAFLKGYRPEFNARGNSTLPYRILAVDQFLKIAYLAANSPDNIENVEMESRQLPAIVSISGDCSQPGIYQVQNGMRIRELLQRVGADDACVVQIGGISAELKTAEDFDQIINPFDLQQVASIIVYGPQTDLLEAAKDILAFFHEASCGQCVPCRNGIPVLMQTLQAFAGGKKMRPALPEIRSLAETIQLASKCRLGQYAPNAFLSVLEIADQDLHGGLLAR